MLSSWNQNLVNLASALAFCKSGESKEQNMIINSEIYLFQMLCGTQITFQVDKNFMLYNQFGA